MLRACDKHLALEEHIPPGSQEVKAPRPRRDHRQRLLSPGRVRATSTTASVPRPNRRPRRLNRGGGGGSLAGTPQRLRSKARVHDGGIV